METTEFDNRIEAELAKIAVAEALLTDIKDETINQLLAVLGNHQGFAEITPIWVALDKSKEEGGSDVLFAGEDSTNIKVTSIATKSNSVYVVDSDGKEHNFRSFGVVTVNLLYGQVIKRIVNKATENVLN